jgi:hypothetical protein
MKTVSIGLVVWYTILLALSCSIEVLEDQKQLGPKLSLLFMNSQKDGSDLGEERTELILSFLLQEWNAKHPSELLSRDEPPTVHKLNVPLQLNLHDCALFEVKCFEKFIEDFIV